MRWGEKSIENSLIHLKPPAPSMCVDLGDKAFPRTMRNENNKIFISIKPNPFYNVRAKVSGEIAEFVIIVFGSVSFSRWKWHVFIIP